MGVICPNSQGRPHHSSALTKQMFPFLSIPVDPLYVKRKKSKLLTVRLWWDHATSWLPTTKAFLTHGLLSESPGFEEVKTNGYPPELWGQHVPGRREQAPAHGRYSSLNMKLWEWEELYAPPHTTTQQSPDNVMVREATPAAGMSLSL